MHRSTPRGHPLSPTGAHRPCRLLTIDTYRSVFRSPHRIAPDRRSRQAAQASRALSAREVNERYRQHPATGSFAVETEGEITHWDKFAAHGSVSRHRRRRDLRRTGQAGAGARRAATRWPHIASSAGRRGAGAHGRRHDSGERGRARGQREHEGDSTPRHEAAASSTADRRGAGVGVVFRTLRPSTPQRHRSRRPRARRRPPPSPTSRLSTRAHGGRSGPPACRLEVGHEGH